MPEPHHISSLVVHCRPERAAEVVARIGALPGMEVRAAEGGKLVVLLETTSEAEIVERLNAAQLLDGVLAATLVYHHVETLEPEPASIGSSLPWMSHAAR